jgi:hypothetical protein
MGDKYGYMVNPGEAYQMGGNPTPKIKTWMWVAGLFVVYPENKTIDRETDQ